ncbi:hypothetical protein NQ317_010217 [Molorchus minor]|uniref:Uncharacterized protein n=1 Tax=Molorchus minor TaxID=1323400 RepID=A0ABQ9JPT8_9CUCU|nr:hypothetical protein NQ317_010217 [Molorchus minor]
MTDHLVVELQLKGINKRKQMAYTENEMASTRGELEIVQKALKLQTKRCRQLVAEYTRRLQEKEQQYRSEKALREDQLSKVLRALLIFEARLKQEQKYITHQLNEKDYIIKRQSNDIKKLLSNQYCKSCNQYYTSSPLQESLDSSSEYVVTDYQDYQSSNFESLDSSSETYATVSEKSYNRSESSCNNEESSKSETGSMKNIYQKNRNKDSLGRRSKKIPHRKSIGTYFEVLKLRNDNASPISNEDNTSNDYDNLDSLPPESITDKISAVSGNIEQIFDKNQAMINGGESSPNISVSECNNTVINKSLDSDDKINNSNTSGDINFINNKKPEQKTEETETVSSKITETIPVFDAEGETNDNWYASASDQEDEEHRDIYRNNPVLECMNQILLQNINDPLSSPPKTPNVERKVTKNKRVKFSDEEEHNYQEAKESPLTQQNLSEKQESNHDYYETPIQKAPNFYETPQSIYSNDYEQILIKCSETFNNTPTKPVVDKDIVKKSNTPTQPHYYVDMELKVENIDPEKINDVKTEKANKINKNIADKDVISDDNLVVKKCVEKLNIQLAKQTPIKSEINVTLQSQKTSIESEIPKLPQVSEIIIPDENEEKIKEDRITQDNYVKNNSQILKLKPNSRTESLRKPIIMGTSVSSLITGFNNHQLISEIKKKPERNSKVDKHLFSSFENIQNVDKQTSVKEKTNLDTSNFENFDLSQNFEEFKLDDCEIEEYNVEDDMNEDNESQMNEPPN